MKLHQVVLLALAALAVNALAAPQERLTIVLHTPLDDLAANASHGEYGTMLRRSTIHATQFRPMNAPAELKYLSGGYFYLPSTAGGDGYYYAPAELPDGASLCYIGLYAYDNATTTHISTTLFAFGGGFQAIGTTIPATGITQLPIAGTASSTGIGLELAAADVGGSGLLGFPNCVTINNDVLHGGYQYLVRLLFDHTADNAQAVRAVELAWYRQISPAPATATFTDVPTTHTFFQAVEAVKAAGITTGKTATTYAPDEAVTRGQMAAFLARALGL